MTQTDGQAGGRQSPLDPLAAGLAGRQAMAEGRLHDAELLLSWATNAKEAHASFWPDLCLLYIRTGRVGLALKLVGTPPTAAVQKLFMLFRHLALTGEHVAIAELAEVVAEGGITRMIADFWLAFSRYRQGRHDDAVGLFFRASDAGAAAIASGINLPLIADLILPGRSLIADARLEALDREQPEPPLDWIGPTEPPAADMRGTPVVVFGCDSRYFVKFVHAALAHLRDGGVFKRAHVHVVGADEATREVVSAIRTAFPGLSLGFTSELPPTASPLLHFASCRFFVAERLMDHYGRDLLIADIDDGLLRAAGDLITHAAKSDVGAFRQPTQLPWLNFLAGVVFVRNGPAGRRFLRLAAHAIRDHLAESRWLTDQAALYCAAQYLQARNLASFCDFSATTGGPISGVLTPLCTSAEKVELRRQALTQRNG